MKARYIAIIGFILVLILAAAAFYLLIRFDPSRIKTSISNRFGDMIGRKVKISGNLDIRFKLPLTISLYDIQVQNASWSSEPQMAKIRQLDLSVSFLSLLFGNVRIYMLGLNGADILLETSEAGKWNFKPVSGPLPIEKVQIAKSRLVYRNDRSSKRYQIDINELNADLVNHGRSISLAFQGAYKKLPLSVDGSLPTPAALLNSPQVSSVAVKVASGANSLSIDGNIKSDKAAPALDAEFKLTADKPAELAGIISYPLDSINSVRASGHFQNTGLSSFRFSNLSITSGKNSLGGQIVVQAPAGTTVLKADLNSKYLDLRDIIFKGHGEDNKAGNGSSRQGADQLFADRPLNLNFLSNYRADIQFKAKRLLLPYFTADNVEITGNLKDGLLSLKPIEADLKGGRLTGKFAISTNKQVPTVDTKMQIKNLGLAPMLETLGVTDALKGNLGLDVNLHGHGSSPADIVGSLNGKIIIVLRDGQIAVEYLKKAKMLDIDLTADFLKLFAFTKKHKHFADINCFVSKFKVTDGIADAKVLVFDTDRVGVLGDGSINLRAEKFNISLAPIEKGGIGLSGVGKVNVGLGDIPGSFKLRGTFSHPVITVDKSQTAISTAVTLGKAIGGTLLFGPAGLLAALVDLDFGEENPCVAAMKKAVAEEK